MVDKAAATTSFVSVRPVAADYDIYDRVEIAITMQSSRITFITTTMTIMVMFTIVTSDLHWSMWLDDTCNQHNPLDYNHHDHHDYHHLKLDHRKLNPHLISSLDDLVR